MPNKALIQELDGTPKQICFADHAGDFSPTAANDLRDATAGNREDVEMALVSLADASYYQSAKADLGEHRAEMYQLRAALEFGSAPTKDHVVTFYWAPSQSATAANGNPGNASGSKGSYTGYSSNADSGVRQMLLIGNFVCSVQSSSTVQVASGGILFPPSRYGALIVFNDCGAAIHTDDVECHIVLDPIIPEIQ